MSSDVVIRVDGIGKRYVAPHKFGRDNLRSRLIGHLKEFIPFFRQSEEDYFWALKDVSFEVKRGDIVGILGRNGSGKSTLLKILSGVTLPTTGRAWLKGRVGSLLEVGTGFHPEMTGRENVFFAGAFLGLSQREVRAKFDEIVDFSGIEDFIDLPVKRYSSGMYVRLAYSVASMLRSDILILDEVMAVGDSAFREKSQKNITRAASDGRTILFVSHNIPAVKQLCQSGFLLNRGSITRTGNIAEVASQYLREVQKIQDNIDVVCSYRDLVDAPRFDELRKVILKSVELLSEQLEPVNAIKSGDSLRIRIKIANTSVQEPYFTVFFLNDVGERVMTLYSTHNFYKVPTGEVIAECKIPSVQLVPGLYRLMIDFGSFALGQFHSVDCVPNAIAFNIDHPGNLGPPRLVANQGYLLQPASWETVSAS